MRKFESQQFYQTQNGETDEKEISPNGSDHDTITSPQGKSVSAAGRATILRHSALAPKVLKISQNKKSCVSSSTKSLIKQNKDN